MKYTQKQKEFLKENKIDSFKPFPFITRDQQLFMIQYDSVRKFTDGHLLPILPRIEKEKFIFRQSKMNFKNWNEAFEKEQFEDFKKNTYGLKNNLIKVCALNK